MSQLLLTALPNVPLVEEGDDLVKIICDGMSAAEIILSKGDILIIASKIVSKAEGRLVSLGSVLPGEEAKQLASVTAKDAREIELMLRESDHVVRTRKGLIITRHRLGFTSANAGLDHSNVRGESDWVILLPRDPDQTARTIRSRLEALTGADVGVVIADSHGRPHRLGTVGVAIGAAGLTALEDWRGRSDLYGRVLQYTEVGLADMVASAATLLLGQSREATPIVHMRGLPHSSGDGSASDLVRPAEMDLFL